MHCCVLRVNVKQPFSLFPNAICPSQHAVVVLNFWYMILSCKLQNIGTILSVLYLFYWMVVNPRKSDLKMCHSHYLCSYVTLLCAVLTSDKKLTRLNPTPKIMEGFVSSNSANTLKMSLSQFLFVGQISAKIIYFSKVKVRFPRSS